MYKIIYELAVYDGPVEGICRTEEGGEIKIYYYCITKDTNILKDKPRAYYVYELDGVYGNPLTWQVITENELTK